MSDRRNDSGFTLIEVMIVVAIIAILASIAYPSYQNSIVTSHRNDAMGALQGLAQAMERHYSENGTYLGAAVGPADRGDPDIFPSASPVDGGIARYKLKITDSAASYYTVQAQPVLGGSQDGDGIIQLKSNGAKSWAGRSCWRKSC